MFRGRPGPKVIGDRHPIGIAWHELVLSVWIARKHLQRTGRVPATGVRQRPHERVLISLRRQSWKQLANLDARNVRIDRRKRPAKVGPGFGLGIKCFEMTGPAAEPNENHGRRLGDRLLCRLSAKSKQAWQAQAGKAPQADFEQCTTAAPLRLPGRMRPETRLNGMEPAVGCHCESFWRRDFLEAGFVSGRLKYDASPNLPQDSLQVPAAAIVRAANRVQSVSRAPGMGKLLLPGEGEKPCGFTPRPLFPTED